MNHGEKTAERNGKKIELLYNLDKKRWFIFVDGVQFKHGFHYANYHAAIETFMGLLTGRGYCDFFGDNF